MNNYSLSCAKLAALIGDHNENVSGFGYQFKQEPEIDNREKQPKIEAVKRHSRPELEASK